MPYHLYLYLPKESIRGCLITCTTLWDYDSSYLLLRLFIEVISKADEYIIVFLTPLSYKIVGYVLLLSILSGTCCLFRWKGSSTAYLSISTLILNSVVGDFMLRSTRGRGRCRGIIKTVLVVYALWRTNKTWGFEITWELLWIGP
jgi:hypothetical protein